MKFRPNQIVHVKRADYSHYGEVMSFITPAGTLMVRRVPGHPGTLEELPAEQILPLDGPKPTKVHYARVGGILGSSFPVDMLRYEFASPVNFELYEDGHRTLARLLEGFDGIEGLWVATCTARGAASAWTPARWDSFLWSIMDRRTFPL